MALQYVLGCILALTLALCAAEEERKAVAVLSHEVHSVKGTVLFSQQSPNSEVFVTVNITGLAKGEHGFHVHVKGDIRENCGAAQGHFNPENKSHGAPNATERHVGDLGNIVAEDGKATLVNLTDHKISLFGTNSIIGRAVVVHEGQDDLGLGNQNDSKTTGHAGGRVACGVIGIQSPISPWYTGSADSLTKSATTAVMSVLLVTFLKYLVM